MHMDPAMPQVVGAIFVMLLTGLILKFARQPHVVSYLIVGILIGPWGLGLITDTEIISRLGAVGVVLLLFFVGMETDASKLVANWKLAIFGTTLQITLSVGCVWLIGLFFGWSMSRVLLIGFVISLSSTAVVIKLLQDKNLLSSHVGQGVLGVLLAQDLAIIPMLIVLGAMGTGELNATHLIKQGVGAIATACIFGYIVTRKQIHIPLGKLLKQDRDLQLFAALSICFGLPLATAWLELSTALGAFIAGMLVGSAKETQWVHHTLESIKVLFVALFFVSVGLILDVNFLTSHWLQAACLTLAALLTNTIVNGLILRAAHFSWRDSCYAGALLSQIGEFSFVLAAVGLQAGIINSYGYQLSLCVISLTLLISPLWISLGGYLTRSRVRYENTER